MESTGKDRANLDEVNLVSVAEGLDELGVPRLVAVLGKNTEVGLTPVLTRVKGVSDPGRPRQQLPHA